MRYLIVSDIHGSIERTRQFLDKFKQYECDKILCLGDILYHGPRNNLPSEYNPREVAILLNSYKEYIISVKGNCDSEVDQMVLEFDLTPAAIINNEGTVAYLTHGHLVNPQMPLKTAKKGEIVFYGHSHINNIENVDGVYYINPGSITLPKEDTKNSFIIFDPKCISIYDLDDNLINFIDF